MELELERRSGGGGGGENAAAELDANATSIDSLVANDASRHLSWRLRLAGYKPVY